MSADEIRQLIEAGLPGSHVTVYTEDNTHFGADVEWEGFAGKLPLAQHRLVYDVIGERMGREIHALSLRTRAPENQ